ncbi:hypothetical protein E1B28_006617 [Marasmius oreades]|uniref:ubiquitinyl hydrolase 1 n=1 Tax=Marasmius oreades TaxID=181124 RepID=A0A9P7UWI0_9AGAR|nr:uncharacterized protein E1B28_006617 [Marasmius oreades]KAG7095933.1 hypothetical protein E1B28_006617 [Marasmius oreades]
MEIDSGLDRLQEQLRSILTDKTKLNDFLAQKGQPAQAWLDRMQQLVDYPNASSELRSSIFTIMLRLSKNSGLHPKCLMIQNVQKMGDYPIAAGGFGDVWKGVIGNSTEPVCLKIVKIYQKSDVEKLSREYIREAIVWRQMKHPNLLPFFGIYYLEQNQQLCLISPWMEKGNLIQYLKSTPRKDVEHYTLVHDVTAGLHYLHLMKFVHGDLKGINVLITRSGRACIGDFGLSRIADTHGLRLTTSTTRPVGTARWLAPELLSGSGTSKESDMYAYGCVCFEIFTGSHPFPEIANEMAVAFNVAQGKRMTRPQRIAELSDDMWAIMESCWNPDPSARPSAEDVLSKVKPLAPISTPAGSEWSGFLPTEIWNNVEHQVVHRVFTQDDSLLLNRRRRMSDEREPDLYLTVKVITDETFANHEGFDLAFLEEKTWDASELPNFRVLKTEHYSVVKSRVTEYFNLAEEKIRLWVLKRRQNGTIRPHTYISNETEPSMTVDDIRVSMAGKNDNHFALYLDVIPDTSESVPPTDSVMVFLKHFDALQQTLRGVGKVYMSKGSTISDVLPVIREKMRWTDSELTLVKEVAPERTYLLIDLSDSFRSYEDGDVICFQKDLEESTVSDLGDRGFYLRAMEFYNFLFNRVRIIFRPLMEEIDQGDPEFSLVLDRRANCNGIGYKVGEYLGHDPFKLRFTTTHGQNPKRKPIRHALSENVEEIITPYDDNAPVVLLYEKLDVSVFELEAKRHLDVIWTGIDNSEHQMHSFLLPRRFRVNDVVDTLIREVTPGSKGVIRIFQVMSQDDGATIRKEFTGGEAIDEIPESVDLYAEEIPEEINARMSG